MSLAIFSVLLGGMSAAVLIAMRAIPDSQSAVSRFIQGGEITQQILTELREAKHFTERGANAVAFTVADRDGDGSPERIRYAWSGTAGDPLTRRYNGGSVVNVLENVYKFDLNYDTKDVTEEYPGPLIETAERELFSYDSESNLTSFDVVSGEPFGEYFSPSFPVEAEVWTVNRILIRAKRELPANGETWIQLRPADDNQLPTSTVLEQQMMQESDLTTEFLWQTFTFTDVTNLDPNRGLCLVLEWNKGDIAAIVEYQGGSVVLPNAGLLEDDEGDWQLTEDKALLFYVYGTHSVLGPPQTATRQYVTGVRVSLQSGDDAAARIDSAVRTLNTPEVLLAYWELDFDADPRAVDMNGDGMGDWDEYAGPFDPATLINGIWYAPFSSGEPGISTVPDEDFAELTTVEIRYRATSVGGWGADFWINADRQGGQSANLIANLRKPTAGSQELRIGHELAGQIYEWLGTYDVPDDFVDVRLVIDPAKGTFAVFVDGAHKDTFTYWWGNTDPEAKAWVYRWNCSAEFDHVSIRVGGNN